MEVNFLSALLEPWRIGGCLYVTPIIFSLSDSDRSKFIIYPFSLKVGVLQLIYRSKKRVIDIYKSLLKCVI